MRPILNFQHARALYQWYAHACARNPAALPNKFHSLRLVALLTCQSRPRPRPRPLTNTTDDHHTPRPQEPHTLREQPRWSMMRMPGAREAKSPSAPAALGRRRGAATAAAAAPCVSGQSEPYAHLNYATLAWPHHTFLSSTISRMHTWTTPRRLAESDMVGAYAAAEPMRASDTAAAFIAGEE
jgi:hypothetical protein